MVVTYLRGRIPGALSPGEGGRSFQGSSTRRHRAHDLRDLLSRKSTRRVLRLGPVTPSASPGNARSSSRSRGGAGYSAHSLKINLCAAPCLQGKPAGVSQGSSTGATGHMTYGGAGYSAHSLKINLCAAPCLQGKPAGVSQGSSTGATGHMTYGGAGYSAHSL